jgi:UDP-N-acetylmuramate: L-alanyl-gamma-D-glutamyl-meso-diaminopimelate ligase
VRALHPEGSLIGVFEPRSATASRNLHQADYATAFGAADLAILAPVGRPEIPASERLDVAAVARGLRGGGKSVETAATTEEIIDIVVDRAQPGDTVLLMSNGPFGGLHGRILEALTARAEGAVRRAPEVE